MFYNNGYGNNNFWANIAKEKEAEKVAAANSEYAISQIGRPDRPVWESLLGSDGLMQDQYQVKDAYNTGALEQMRTDYLRDPGEASAWRGMQGDLLNVQAGQANSQAQQDMRSAMNQMASRGGLRSGASERLAGRTADNATLARQGIMGQRMNLDLQDEQMRMQGLNTLNQAEMGAATNAQKVQEYNINAALQDTTQKRYADLEAYKEQMSAWGAQKTAEATPSGGGGKK